MNDKTAVGRATEVIHHFLVHEIGRRRTMLDQARALQRKLAAAGLLADPAVTVGDTVQERAAAVIAWADWGSPRNAIERLEVADIIAAALATAGLLADPTTSRTDAEQAVIDAAKALAADWATYPSGCPDWDTETLALIAAVDRLTAIEGAT